MPSTRLLPASTITSLLTPEIMPNSIFALFNEKVIHDKEDSVKDSQQSAKNQGMGIWVIY